MSVTPVMISPDALTSEQVAALAAGSLSPEQINELFKQKKKKGNSN